MTDARIPRRAQVVLLDDRKLDFLVQPRLIARELLDMVASYFNLHEKEYFGLYHTDDIGNENWLSLERKVLDHDLPRYADPIVFYFAVRFYVPSITYFKEKVTVELFYLQAKTLIFKGNIHCESNIVFELGAYVLQATFGDFTNENAAKNDMKKVPILPTRTLKEHPSITYCENMVIGHYRGLEKMRKGQAIVEYLNKFRTIPTYGVHYYEVKDKGNIPWWLGMSPKGVGVYDHSDKTKPRKVYKWHQIENLYFKERKFSIEIKNLRKISEVSLDGGRARSNSLGRRVNGQTRVLIHAWYAGTTAQAKAMWSMAISQHQFYLDRKDKEDKSTTPRTLEDIANELSRSSGSLNSSMASVISDSSEPSESGHSSNGGESGISSEIAQKEMITALAARKEALETRLKEKIEELRQICFREANITGEYPPETPFNPNCSPPPVRKRVGTSFTFSDFAIEDNLVEEREQKIQKLERELEIQSKITDAAEKLANDPKASKNVKKSRKLIYQKSFSKLKTMQQALKRMKESQSEDHGLDGNSLNSYEDELDSIKPPSSRRSSFEAATGQRRASNTNSIDNSVNPTLLSDKTVTSGSTSSNEELASPFYPRFNETPAFASSTTINEMFYKKRLNVPSQSSNPASLLRLDSSSSISSTSSLRPQPPSYSESRFSRRESSLGPHDRRRGSAPGLYQNNVNRAVVERFGGLKTEILNNNTGPTYAGSTKVRYIGGGSPSQSDSDYNSDDVQVTHSPPTIITSDKTAGHWVSTSSRNRSSITTARYNYPSKLGIMSNSESTGSYFVNDNFIKPHTGHVAKAHLYASTSALNQPQLMISGSLPRSHHSSYAIHNPVVQKRQPFINRFLRDGRNDWSGDESLV